MNGAMRSYEQFFLTFLRAQGECEGLQVGPPLVHPFPVEATLRSPFKTSL